VASNTELIFQDRRYSEKCWTHNIEDLVKLANLQTAREADIADNETLGKNWLVVKDWTETARYQQKSQTEAEKLFDADNDNTNGVMQWIRDRW